VAPRTPRRSRSSGGRVGGWTGYLGLNVAQLDALFDITSKNNWKWDDIVFDIGIRLSDLAHQDGVFLATTTDDIRRAKESDRVAFVISIEGAAMIENELDRIDVLYGLGVRCLGIAYSEGNALGAGLREPRDGGLTVFGRQAVRRMNRLGMAIDVSHSGDQTSPDTIEASDAPIFITHSGVRALWDSRRLKPDDVIRGCAGRAASSASRRRRTPPSPALTRGTRSSR
jgi:membrane dipeptidase